MRKAPAIFLLAAALALAGCGYRPLYGSSAETAGVAATLAAISIPEPTDRVGQLVRNDLMSSMQAGKGSEEKYLLNMTIKATDNGIIQKKLPAVTRQAVLITVDYELVDKSSGTTVSKGRTFSRASYDVVRQPFADMQAQTDAQERAAHEVAADIRTRLAAYFASKQPRT